MCPASQLANDFIINLLDFVHQNLAKKRFSMVSLGFMHKLVLSKSCHLLSNNKSLFKVRMVFLMQTWALNNFVWGPYARSHLWQL